MIQNELTNRYFDWMYQLVCDDKYNRRLSYRKLLYFLHDVEFAYSIDMDGNREADGINLRYRFGYECRYDDREIATYLDDRPCSVLEMMIALALRCEDDIMDNPAEGNRIGEWFWEMIVSLGLGSMSDSKFDRRYVETVIARFLNREYEPNGRGGLFTVKNPLRDMRNVEIWYQMQWYLNDILEN